MKKIYCSPLVYVVELAAVGVVAVSAALDEAGITFGSGTVDPDEAWAGESRDGWSDIWDSM